MGDPRKSVEQHEAILDELAAGDLEAACCLLRENMTVGMELLLARLEASDEGRAATEGG